GSFDPGNPNLIDRDSAATDQITAYIDNAHVVAGGDLQVVAGYQPLTAPAPTQVTVAEGATVTLPAEAHSRLVSVTVGGAAANQFAFGGSVSINVIAHDISAYITGSRAVEATGSILVSAVDDVNATSVAGGIAIGQNAAGIGVALQIDKSQATAYIGAG